MGLFGNGSLSAQILNKNPDKVKVYPSNGVHLRLKAEIDYYAANIWRPAPDISCIKKPPLPQRGLLYFGLKCKNFLQGPNALNKVGR